MKLTIYKYPLLVLDTQVVELPVVHDILTVQVQNEEVCLWAMVDTSETSKEKVVIRMFGTGHPVPDSPGIEYISTIQLSGGSLVFHIFKQL